MTTLNNDELREQVSSAFTQLRTRALRDAPVYSSHVSMAESKIIQLIQAHDKQLLEAILEGLRGKVIPCNTDGEGRLAETLFRDFEEHIKSVFKKEGE